MQAEAFIREGNPSQALEALQNQVRADPANADLRVFLFQLLSVLGDWTRAGKQLAVLEEMDDGAIAMVRVYEDLLNCERHRTAVFQGKVRPLVFGEPEPWTAQLIEAQQALSQGETESFLTLNASALEAAPAIPGRINGEPFEWLADGDRRFGPVLEMMFNNHYYWVPLSRISAIKCEPPEDLRDLVWLPAEVTWTNGGQLMAMLPARYPELDAANGQSLLGQFTDWRELHEDLTVGVGQKILASEQGDYPLLQVRSVEFDH